MRGAHNNIYIKTGICSVMHLLVDGICVCCLYIMGSAFSMVQITSIFITYNILAFLTQPFTGLLADIMKRKHWMLLTSVLLLISATLIISIIMHLDYWSLGMPVVAVLLGIGNSLFHVWGGKIVAVGTGNDIRALGAFVATGAMGLSIGIIFFSWLLLYLMLLSFSLLSLAYLHYDEPDSSVNSIDVTGKDFSKTFIILSIIAIMIAIVFRSYVSEMFSIGVSKSSETVFLLGFLSMLGKMTGGLIARWIGIVRMIVIVFLVLTFCFLFRSQGTTILLIALFAVNSTMPVTLYLANVVLNGREGLAFGLLAAALIPGYLLALCI